MREITFSELCGFSDKQWLASETADANRYTLFGGSRGPGKSYWLRWYSLRRLLIWGARGFRGVRVMLGCEDYPSLYERQVSKVQIEFPAHLGTFFAARNEYRLHDKYGGGAIAFRNLDDPSKYQSAEFALMAIDEITKNRERTFHILRGSLRWPGIDDVGFVAASNPEANWVRDYWIEKRLPDELTGLESQFAFVPALPEDNPHLPESYWQMLDTLPGALRQAWRYGDWYAAVEGLVYDSFNAENITDEEPDPERPIELAIDDGYTDPRATLFIQRKANGDVLVFDELYQTKHLEEETINAITDKCETNGWPRPEIAAVSHEAVALQRRLREANIPARNWLATKAGGGGSTRVQAIQVTRGLICDGKGYRALKVHRRCKNLLDEIMAGYKYPEGKKSSVNDKPEDGNDHACNALESWCWLRARRG